MGRLIQINVSAGGMPKRAVHEARITCQGVAGDVQRNRKYHGGPNRAICLYSEELYAQLRQHGVDLKLGEVGENFSTEGIDLLRLRVGDRLRVGECIIEITEPRTPCRNLNVRHKDLMKLMKGRSGWLAKVLVEGAVRAGDYIDVLTREGQGGGDQP